MQNITPFDESFWFIRVNEVEEYEYPEIKMVFKEFDDKEYCVLKSNHANIEHKESQTNDLTQIEQIYSYLIKIASTSKINGVHDFAKAYSRLYKKEIPNSLKRCFISFHKIYKHLEEIRENENVIRVNFKDIFQLLDEYFDLFITLELMIDLSPSKRIRHNSEIDTEIRSYKSTQSKYLASESDINLHKYIKFRNFNYHWQQKEGVSPKIIVDIMSDLFSGRINRIDNFYLPAIIKQIWFVKEINDRQICKIIIPLIKLLKSVDKKIDPKLFYASEAEFKNDSVQSKKEMFSSYEEYCFAKINRLVKTKQPYAPFHCTTKYSN